MYHDLVICSATFPAYLKNAYGDDAHMTRNYPLVRLKRIGCNNVYFCRTFNHSIMAVATGKKVVHTHFHVPHMVPVGHYELTLIANGIQSQSVSLRQRRCRDTTVDLLSTRETILIFNGNYTKFCWRRVWGELETAWNAPFNDRVVISSFWKTTIVL